MNSDPIVKPEDGAGTAWPQPSRRGLARRWIGRLVALLVVLPLLYLSAGFVWQYWLGPKVDPNLTRAVARPAELPDLEAELPGLLAGLSQARLDQAENPLDVVLDLAERARTYLRENVMDYRCLMISEVRLGDGKLREAQYLSCKIREHRERDGKVIPFAVYGKFLKPQRLLGQEVIWVEGQHSGNLIAHQPGLLNLTRWSLPPTGALAMSGNKYPLTEIGLENLLEQMIERGRRDRAHGSCQIRFDPGVDLDGRRCVRLDIVHPERSGPYDFHIARIYIDIERQMLIGYEGLDWPAQPGGEPPLIERFFYSDIELNVGWTDLDFDPDNPAYNYPRKR